MAGRWSTGSSTTQWRSYDGVMWLFVRDEAVIGVDPVLVGLEVLLVIVVSLLVGVIIYAGRKLK